jgi:DNA-binding transcriptional LysR family regulator
MQIESLKVYCDLVETESFTKAAQINNVTQSAVSQQISALERQFKSLLIERSKKKFRLTREGTVLYTYSRQVIQTYDSLQNRLQEIKDIISGTIRVATIYSIGLHELPPYLKRFLKMYPTVNVHVEYRRANQVYEDILGNVVDVGLVAYPTRDPKVEMVPLRKDVLVMICHPSHPLARSKSIKLSQSEAEKFISSEPVIPSPCGDGDGVRQHRDGQAGGGNRSGHFAGAPGNDHPGSGQTDAGRGAHRGGGLGASAGGDLQKEQGALAGHETIPGRAQGLKRLF